MTIRNSILPAGLALALALVGPAFAAGSDDAMEKDALLTATVTAADAIASVEKLGGGSVVELTLEGNARAVAYRITLLGKDGTESNFIVDAKTGSVVEVAETPEMGDGDGEHDDDGDGDGEIADDNQDAEG